MFEINNDFDGVFRFTNATEEDFTALWNNKEYVYPKGTCCPMIIPNETLENIQEIRKRFAYKLAVREFYKSKTYDTMKDQGRGLPPTFDEKVLQPWIDQCLSPLPIARAEVNELPKDSESNYKGSKAVDENTNLNEAFKDAPVVSLGSQSNSNPGIPLA